MGRRRTRQRKEKRREGGEGERGKKEQSWREKEEVCGSLP